VQLDIAAAGLVVGLIIGLTGMGGGALMTPILVIFFGVSPSAAISSDVVASFVLKPIGGGVHARRGTVRWDLVRWLALGSVPSAFAGAWIISNVGGDDVENRIKQILGVVLLLAATGMLVKVWLQHHRPAAESDAPFAIRPIPTIVIGIVGGVMVGMTSVGSGSLMIVALMLLYPALSSRELVGTDLVQAVPLVGAAALGHLVFGSMSMDLTLSVLLGAIPGVYVGAHISSRASDRFIRPLLIAVLTISSMKLLGASNALLLVATIAACVCVTAWTVTTTRQTRRTRQAGERSAMVVAPSNPRVEVSSSSQTEPMPS
jgi:uncharacterized membrane protein YfcA